MLDPRQTADGRFAALMRVAARARAQETLPPPGLETSLLAFADGAARCRRRWSLWPFAGLVAVSSAASVLAIWLAMPRTVTPPEPLAVAPLPGARVAAPRPAATPLSHGSPSLSPPPSLVSALLGTADWRSREVAARVLAKLAPSPEADRALSLALARDPDWRVREAALDAVRLRPGRVAERALARATEDPHFAIRLTAVTAIVERASLGPDLTEALLRRVRRDPDWRVRETALGRLLRSPEGRRAASFALADGHSRLRALARTLLAASR